MAVHVNKSKRLFNVDEYHRMGDVGIFHEDSQVELLEGEVWEKHPSQPYRYTVEDYERMIEGGILGEDERVELIEGEIVQMSPVGRLHVACVNRLDALLHRRVAQEQGIVSVQNPIQIKGEGQPQPDVALLKQKDDFYAKGLPTAEDVLLLVEVSDTTLAFDRERKVPMYAAAGVREVWIVDLAGELVEVYTQPEGGKYGVVKQARRGETVEISAVPGVVLGVNDILG